MRLWVVVPAFQAARHVGGVIRRLVAARPPGLAGIVVVDDGSTDGTADVVRAEAARAQVVSADIATSTAGETPSVPVPIRLIVRERNGGYGAAMKMGLQAAWAAGAERAASVHADGQYSPEVLSELLAALEQSGLDLLQGSRIAGGAALAGGMPLYKYAGNWLLNKLERRVLSLPLSDFHSGYLVYGPRALAGLPFGRLSDSFDFDMEVIASARARGLAVGEAPIPTRYADEVSHLRPLRYGMRVLRVLWRFKRGVYA